MKTILLYLLEVTAISGILYGYYHFFLRNKKFHDYNRYYLLSAILISVIIPFLNIPIYFTLQQAEPSALLHTLTTISAGGFEEHMPDGNSAIKTRSLFTANNIIVSLYSIAVTLLFIRFGAGLLKILKLKRKFPVEKTGNIDFVNTNETGTPFSFFRNLFWNEKIALDSEHGQQIFRHELFHIQQKHSLDIIFIEIVSVIFWMNPFFFLLKKEIKTIHEFLADSFAVHKNREWDYAELLLMQVLGSPHTRLTNTFFHNQIKRRIAMITSSKKTSYQYLRKLLVLPVAVVITALFAFKYKTKEEPGFKHLSFAKTVTVVVDAGHGGKTGSMAADGTYEDDISLAIAKKVKELNVNSKIKIVLTRETSDAMDLKQRSEAGNKQNPDLFISIHCAAAEKDESAASGAEVFVSRKNTKWSIQNKMLGSILLNNFSTIYPLNNNEVQQREMGIWVLDNSNCPAALLECGYITNAKDLAFVKDPANQEKIAKSILLSVEKYAAYKETQGTAQKKDDNPQTVTTSFNPAGTPDSDERANIGSRETFNNIEKTIQPEPVENKTQLSKPAASSYPDESVSRLEEKKIESMLLPKENNITKENEAQSNNRPDEAQGTIYEYPTAAAIEKRKQDLLEIKALAKGTRDVAYIFNGRTYLFANNEATNFTEMDGDMHPLMLNGQLLSSIDEMNRLVNRQDVKEVGFITKEDALRLYNINDYIATVTTR